MKRSKRKFLIIFIIFAVVALISVSAVLTFASDINITDYFPFLGLRTGDETPEATPLPPPLSPPPTPTPPPTPPPTEAQTPTPTPEPTPDPIVTISISAAGDVTVGGDEERNSFRNYMREFEQSGNDMAFFFYNVSSIFAEDDLTLVNLEGTLTNHTTHTNNAFNFRAPPEFAEIFVHGNIDAVSIANNHSMDFGRTGYEDTVESLRAFGIGYFGNEFNTILDVGGINVGLFGYTTFSDTPEIRNRIRSSIEELREGGADLIIAFHHWGREGQYYPTATQRNIGRFTVDMGAHLVLGAHPHVIQGIEVYNGVNIVYSLGNFSFGGNRNPFDMDAFIFRQTFTFYHGVLQEDNVTEVIPVRTTSARGYNNYQPTPAEGRDYERIRNLLERLNSELN